MAQESTAVNPTSKTTNYGKSSQLTSKISKDITQCHSKLSQDINWMLTEEKLNKEPKLSFGMLMETTTKFGSSKRLNDFEN